MKYKVIEHLTHVNSVVVEADNKEEAWSKAMEGGLMSKSSKLDDMYVNKFEVEEVKNAYMEWKLYCKDSNKTWSWNRRWSNRRTGK